MRDTFIRILREMAAENDRIVLITGDLGFGVLDAFAQELPNQYINAGVAEQNMTTIAAGMARRKGEVAKLGKARLLRGGDDITVIIVGAILSEAVAAADRLAAQGIEVRIISHSSLKPFDAENRCRARAR